MNSFLRRYPLVLPIAMLVVASLFGVILLAARIAISRHLRHLYLPWNLFLAWLPLLFALAFRLLQRWPSHRWPTAITAIAWLLFFPNAPYILTDLVHLPDKEYRHYWADMMLIFHFALIGLMLGFLSLHVMRSVVARRFGWLKGWGFVGGACALCGVGIYIGRFLRCNSWDVIFDPVGVAQAILTWSQDIFHHSSAWILPLLFGSTMFLAYLLFSSLLGSTAAPAVSTDADAGRSMTRNELRNITSSV